MKSESHLLQLQSFFGSSLKIKKEILESIQVNDLKIIDLNPDLILMNRTMETEKQISFKRPVFTLPGNTLMISIIDHSPRRGHQQQKADKPSQSRLPHVLISPLSLETTVHLPRYSQIRQITIIISYDYLRHFLGKDQSYFQFLWDSENLFCIEDFLTPEITRLLKQTNEREENTELEEFYYRTWVIQLIYHLFNNLKKRQTYPHQSLSRQEIKTMYKVREAIAHSPDKMPSIPDLVHLSGLNEQKLRKLFNQIFGMGLYDYFQKLRMTEAARLLKDEHLTVSETGYQLGFTNLSHFGRLFESYYGMTPKKWCMLVK